MKNKLIDLFYILAAMVFIIGIASVGAVIFFYIFCTIIVLGIISFVINLIKNIPTRRRKDKNESTD